MADLAYSSVKINDVEVSADAPVTELLLRKVGGAINLLLDKNVQSQTFTSNGTWTPPRADITQVFILGLGGGGGGAGGAGLLGGGGAGGGSKPELMIVPVSFGNTYDVIIGAGGAGGSWAPSFGANGSDGGPTRFQLSGSDLAYWVGGKKGTGYNPPTFDNVRSEITFEANGNHPGGSGSGGSNTASAGAMSMFAGGGAAGTGTYAGGGGGGSWGSGAVGGSSPNGNGSSPSATSGAGGGGGYGGASGGNGGAGGSGRMMIFWFGVP